MNHGKPSLIISVLVDDLVILAEHNETVEWFHTEFSNIYKVSQFEKIKVYNGIHVHRLEKHCYTLSQEYSIAQFLAKYPVQDINACDSPLLPSDTFVLAKEDDTDAVDRMKRTTYQQVLGSLNWFNSATRPDLAVVCSLAGRVASNPAHKQFSALCRTVGYLKRNPKYNTNYLKSTKMRNEFGRMASGKNKENKKGEKQGDRSSEEKLECRAIGLGKK